MTTSPGSSFEEARTTRIVAGCAACPLRTFHPERREFACNHPDGRGDTDLGLSASVPPGCPLRSAPLRLTVSG